MPRPYGWTPGEGRYKGLGQLDDFYPVEPPNFTTYTPAMGPPYTCADGTLALYSANCSGGGPAPGMPLNQTGLADYMNVVNYAVNNPTGNLAKMGAPPPTIGQWLQKNQTLVLVGGILALVFLRK